MADQNVLDENRRLRATVDHLQRRIESLEESRKMVTKAFIGGKPPDPVTAPIARAAPVRDTFTSPVIPPGRPRSK